MKIDYCAIGHRIKQKRKAVRKTQDTLAEALGVSVGYVSQVERGVTKISLDTLAEISAFLNVDISELITGVAPKHGNYLYEELVLVYEEMNHCQKRLLLEIADAILRHN